MRIVMLALLAVATVIPSLGCAGARNGCASCQNCSHGAGCVRNGFFARKFGPGGGGHGAHGGLGGGDGALARNFGPQNYMSGAEEGAGAPQSAQVAYPYYTTRGPRDFLLNNPPPLGY